MNREILFRGFNEDPNGNEEIELDEKTIKGKWVYGDFVQLLGEQGKDRKVIVDNKFGACIDNEGRFVDTESPFVNEVIPETVSQYTGLDDKNGKKIFENDIIKSILVLENNKMIPNIDIVEFFEEECSFMLGKKIRHFHKDLVLEVIGTIFDKKEVSDEENM